MSANSADTVPQTQVLEEVVVTSTRTQSAQGNVETVHAPSLQSRNVGQNLPYLLSTTPSLVVTSDDGLGVGYTYFRVRGTDQTRINMTVNGVPLNDSESQNVFWVNMADFASGLANVQVQRGVGTSTNGAAAFGASVNMQTDNVPDKPYASLAFNGGSYNTFRESAKIGTGLLPSGFAFDARFSKVNSDGYLERAFSDLYSYNFSGAYFNGGSMVKLLVFGGKERTYMAWDGIDAETLAENPRYNPAGKYKDDNGETAFYKNQTDNYAQQHVQLHLAHIFNNKWNVNAALHYTHGEGYYEQYKRDKKYSVYGLPTFINADNEEIKRGDLINRKNLDNNFYGVVASANYKNRALAISFGGAASNYVGDHFGNVVWVRQYPQAGKDFEYYKNQGKKFDANIYAKATYNILKELSVFGDLQYRRVNYSINGINDEDLQAIPVDEKFNFFNPKAGVNFSKNGHNACFNFAVANREPYRKNYTEAGPHDIPTSERLFDYELGYSFAHKIFNAGVNFYFMDYDNQLVLTGQYSETGAYLTKNVKDSYRAGVELVASVQPLKWLKWSGNLTLSQNKIKNFTDWVDDWYADWNEPQVIENEGQVEVHYGTTDISFSPNITAGSVFSFNYKGLTADFQTVYVGKQYLNNTMNEKASLKAYYVNNLVLAYNVGARFIAPVKNIALKLQINNIFNKTKFATNGGAYGYFEGADSNGKFLPENQQYSPWYYAQAGINIHGGVVVEF
ncbi:TonB-dependent receptor [Bacteroidia bacterium]|nr:TonB-dependent receptor [Bacteroidia bacterium]